MTVLLVGHLLVSSIIGIIGKGKLNKQERFCNLMIALFFPVGGYITVLMLFFSNNEHRKTKDIEEEQAVEKEIILFTDRVNKLRDTNVVPLEETLLINDTKVKRQQLLEVLKKDTTDYIDMLNMAIRDDDVETSHYAAAAISEVKRNLDLKLQLFSVEYEENRSNIKLKEDYIKVLEEYLGSKLLDGYERKRLLNTYIDVIDSLLEQSHDESSNYNKIIAALIELGDMEKVEKYCHDFLRKHESENAYLANLKYYYNMKDKRNFDLLFSRLLKSPIELSNRGLRIIRFWLERVK